MLKLKWGGSDDLMQRVYAHWAREFGERGEEIALPVEFHQGASGADRKSYVHLTEDGVHADETAELLSLLRQALQANFALIDAELFEPSGLSLLSLATKRPEIVVRITIYPDATDTLVGAAHTDIDLFTLLPSASFPGLEIYVDGGWRPAPVAESDLLLIEGEVLELLGGPPAIRHRVAIQRAPRLSISAFVNADRRILAPDGRTVAAIMESRFQSLRKGAG